MTSPAVLPISALLQCLGKVRQRGPGKWMASCPAHDDYSPSLSIKECDDGKILIHCFGGCDIHSIIAAIGLELTDLFPADSAKFSGKPAKPPKYRAADLLPLVVTESIVLTLAFRAFAAGKTLSDNDKRRALQAEATILRIWREIGIYE